MRAKIQVEFSVEGAAAFEDQLVIIMNRDRFFLLVANPRHIILLVCRCKWNVFFCMALYTFYSALYLQANRLCADCIGGGGL